MPTPLSNLGIFHTIISLLALIVAAIQIFQEGRIVPQQKLGKLYTLFTLAACVSALGIYRHGGFGPGHVLAVLTILCVLLAYIIRADQRRGLVLQTSVMSTSLLFSIIPAVGETLTRLPTDGPFASGVDDPLVKNSFGLLMLCFPFLLWYQVRKLKR